MQKMTLREHYRLQKARYNFWLDSKFPTMGPPNSLLDDWGSYCVVAKREGENYSQFGRRIAKLFRKGA